MEKFLYFADSDSDGSDAACMPVSLLRKMEIDGSSNTIHFEFQDVRDGIGSQVTISITTIEDKAQGVADRVATAIRTSGDPFIVVIDELATPVEKIHPDAIQISGTVDIT